MVAGFAVAGLVLVPAVAHAEPKASAEEQAAAAARPAIVTIEVAFHAWVRDKRTGEVFGGAKGYVASGSCTGFGVHADGYIVTAAHCADSGPEGGTGMILDGLARDLVAMGRAGTEKEALSGLAEHAVVEGQAQDSPIERRILVHRGISVNGDVTKETLPATVVDVTPFSKGDVALLKVERGRLPALDISPASDLRVGSPLLAIGYPAAAEKISDPTVEPSVKDGKISNRRTKDSVPYYEVSAAASKGMSGGPVIGLDGRVIGLISHGPADETQAFNFISASSVILALLDRAKAPHGPGPIDRNFKAGLDRYFAGQGAEASPFFDAVLAASPGHLQAAEFRKLTADAPAAAPEEASRDV